MTKDPVFLKGARRPLFFAQSMRARSAESGVAKRMAFVEKLGTSSSFSFCRQAELC